MSLFNVHVQLGVLDVLLAALGVLVVPILTLLLLDLLLVLFKYSLIKFKYKPLQDIIETYFLEFHVVSHSQMDQLFRFDGGVVDLFGGLLMLHLKHADTVA